MKACLLLLLLVFLCFRIYGQTNKETEINCANATTQAELNACATKEYRAADKELNTVYQQLIKKVSAGQKTSLIKAQRSWITFRDNHCAVYESLYADASMMPMVVMNCRRMATENRTRELQELLTELENR